MSGLVDRPTGPSRLHSSSSRRTRLWARTVGTSSRSRSSRLAISGEVKNVTPVTLPPGRSSLATSPGATGSPPIANTIGMVAVAAFAARAAGVPLKAAIAATPWAHQVRGQCRQALVTCLGEAVFDPEVAALGMDGFVQALLERADDPRTIGGREAAEEADHRH